MPLAAEHLLVEELEATEHERMRAARDLADVAEMQEVLPDLLLSELVGRAAVVPGELYH